MNQAVMNDQILGPKQVADGADIGGMTTDEYNAVLHVIELGQFLLQLSLNRSFPATSLLADAEVP
jgi:hypothetical protein